VEVGTAVVGGGGRVDVGRSIGVAVAVDVDNSFGVAVAMGVTELQAKIKTKLKVKKRNIFFIICFFPSVISATRRHQISRA